MDPKRRSSLPGPNSQSGERPLDLSQEEGEQAQGESGAPPKRTLSGEQRRPTVPLPLPVPPGSASTWQSSPSTARFGSQAQPQAPAVSRDSFPPSIVPDPPDTDEIILDFDVEGFVSAEPSTIPPPPEALFGQAREQRIADMRTLYSQGLFDKALLIADSLLNQDPFDGYAREYVATCLRSMLGQGSMARVPVLAVHGGELAALPLDPRAAFVLMHVDGLASVEMILDVCAMPEPEALRLLVQMKELGVLRFD